MTPSTCAVHPFRKRDALKTSSAAYAADMNMFMAYAKACDDRKDSGGIKSSLQCSALERHFSRARSLRPDIAADMQASIERLEQIEAGGCADVDLAAEPYGRLLGRVFSDVYVLQSHILYDLGYNLGRWVYLIDAYDDMVSDTREGQFNVFVNKARDQKLSREDLTENVRFSLHFTLSQAADALRRLELKKNRELLTNIVQLGLLAQTESVLSGKGRLDESIRNPRRL